MSCQLAYSPLKYLLKIRILIAISWSFFGFGNIPFFSWLKFLHSLNKHINSIYILLDSFLFFLEVLPATFFIVSLLDSLGSKNMNIRSSCISIIILFRILATTFLLPLAFIQSAEWAACLCLVITFSMAPNTLYYSILVYPYDKQTGIATGPWLLFSLFMTYFFHSLLVSLQI